MMFVDVEYHVTLTEGAAGVLQKRPVKKGVIRGVSFLTGYLIHPLGDQSCRLTYVSQSDPKGRKLPSISLL